MQTDAKCSALLTKNRGVAPLPLVLSLDGPVPHELSESGAHLLVVSETGECLVCGVREQVLEEGVSIRVHCTQKKLIHI